jgi:translocation and assembly module TamB
VSARTDAPPSPRRRWLRRLLLLALASIGVVALLLAWLLGSGSGREFALARVLAALPPDSLAWREAEGTINGPLLLHGVRFEHEGMVIEAERVLIDLAPPALVDRTLHIERLEIERGRVLLPPGDDTPEPWPQRFVLPEALPELRLPLAVALDALEVKTVRIEQGELTLVNLHRLLAAGRFEHGRIALRRLQLDSDRLRLTAAGGLDSASRWDTGLKTSVELLGLSEHPLPLRMDLHGHLEDFTLVAHGDLPELAQLHLRVVGGLPDPRWSLSLEAPRVEPALLGAEGEAVALDLQGDGSLSAANLSGTIERGGRRLVIEPSTLRYDDGRVLLQPLALTLDAGRVDAEGSIDLRPADPLLALQLRWSALHWGDAATGGAITTAGNASVDGTLADYALQLEAGLQRAQQQARLQLRGRGTRERLAIESLRLESRDGELEAEGSVAWTPGVAWDFDARLRRFDPSWIAPDFPGAVDAVIESEGTLEESRPSGTLRIASLDGNLRGRALGGDAQARLQPDGSGDAEARLRIGESRIEARGRWDERIDAQLRLQPLRLADLAPGAHGEIEGTIGVDGARAEPHLSADLRGRALAWDGTVAQSLHLVLDVERSERGRVALQAEGIEVAGESFERAQFDLEGSRADHRAQLEAQGAALDLALRVQGSERDGDWRGTLEALRIQPNEREAWTLREPAALRVEREPTSIVLQSACLVSSSSSLCADADWSESVGHVAFRLDGLPLATLDPVLTARLDTPASAYGTVSAQGRIERRAGVLTGEIDATSVEGGLRLDPESPRDLLVYRDLVLHAQLQPGRAEARFDAKLQGDGTVHAELATASLQDPDAVLDGRVEATLRDLAFLELFGDELVSPSGTADAQLAISGTRRAPALQGEARLRAFAAEVPALGLKLHDGEVTLRSRGAAAAQVEGSIVSGDGTLRVAGEFDAAADAQRTLQLTLKGERVTAAATPELSATVSPDLELGITGSRARLRGKVEVPRARINLERLESATTASPDVVIVDAETAAASEGLQLDSDVSVVLGDDVRLNGFGLKGKLGGQIGVRDRPGRATVARGGLEVGGEYKAYGQDLKITRGRLSYASTPLDDPALDIRAEREIDEITVGVQVRGSALAPELTLWSDPSLDQAEQLSYLVLGRPLRSASQADGAQLSQAAAAFGGNLLAQRLGARMGLDEVGVADSRALGGAALTVGKYLSPKLYVSYGVALFGSGQVVTFKYLLSRVWSVQVDSGSENRAALNYRLER